MNENQINLFENQLVPFKCDLDLKINSSKPSSFFSLPRKSSKITYIFYSINSLILIE